MTVALASAGTSRTRTRTLVFVAVATSLVLAACRVVPHERRPISDVPVIALERYAGQLRTVPVLVGSDTLDFLFDTAGGETLITPAVAAALGCEPSGRSVSYRMSGERIEFSYCPDVTLGIGGQEFRRPRVAVWDLMGMLPTGLPELGGVLSLDAFRGRRFTLDLGGNTLALETDQSARAAALRMRQLRLRVATGMDGSALVPFVAVAGRNGRELWFEFDSANLDRVLVAPHAARLLVADAPGGARTEIGDVELHVFGSDTARVDVVVRDIIYDGALNASWIAERVFLFDLVANRLWAARR